MFRQRVRRQPDVKMDVALAQKTKNRTSTGLDASFRMLPDWLTHLVGGEDRD
jgi:hypothetical protein